jgi:hypothetical protein
MMKNRCLSKEISQQNFYYFKEFFYYRSNLLFLFCCKKYIFIVDGRVNTIDSDTKTTTITHNFTQLLKTLQ